MYEHTTLPPIDFLKLVEKDILSDSKRVDALNVLPNGVYLFGHLHIQFHMKYKGKWLINPGACGEPLDGNPNASYTLLENNRVVERRVQYDVDVSIRALRQSSYYKADKMNAFWAELIIKNLVTGFDYFRSFYALVNDAVRKRGEHGIANEACMLEAIKTWKNR